MTEPSKVEPTKEHGKQPWTRSDIWMKELLGVPLYVAGTLAFLKVTNASNPLLFIIGMLSFVTAYNVIYEYLFPNHKVHTQWVKIALLLIGQIVVGSMILLFAWSL